LDDAGGWLAREIPALRCVAAGMTGWGAAAGVSGLALVPAKCGAAVPSSWGAKRRGVRSGALGTRRSWTFRSACLPV